MFLDCTNQALRLIKDIEDLQLINDTDLVYILFDSLLVDFAFTNYGVTSEEFRALASKHSLTSDPKIKEHLDQLVHTLYELNEKYQK